MANKEIDIPAVRLRLTKRILKAQALSILIDGDKELLADDFVENAAEYAKGIENEAGVLIRRVKSYTTTAKPLAQINYEGEITQ